MKHIAFHSRLTPHPHPHPDSQNPFWDITSLAQVHILLEKMGKEADLGLIYGGFGVPDSIWNSCI